MALFQRMLPWQLVKLIVLRQAHSKDKVKIFERLVHADPTGCKGGKITGAVGFAMGVEGLGIPAGS